MNVNRKRKSKLLPVLSVILLICEAASLAVLFNRMSDFSADELINVISLTQSGERTKVTLINGAAGNNFNNQTVSQGKNPSFVAYDANTVWQSETDVEIFKLSYENGEGNITVISNDGLDKLIAPGTSNEYEFTLENTGDVALDYTLEMEAWVEGTDLWLPVKARVWDYTNRYLLGSENHSEDALELNTVNDDGVLGAGRYASYTLEWEWPFEQGIDEYDTMLGNLAVDDDLSLYVRIKTMAMYDENPDDPKISDAGLEAPKTGDNMPVAGLVIIMSVGAVTALGCGFIKRKQDEE